MNIIEPCEICGEDITTKGYAVVLFIAGGFGDKPSGYLCSKCWQAIAADRLVKEDE